MCATKRKTSNAGVQVGMIMELSLDEFRRPKGKITTEPSDTPVMVQTAIQAMATMLNMSAQPSTQVAPAPVIATTSKLLSDYVEPYLAHVLAANKPTEKTLESYRAAIALFVDIVGDKPLSTLAVTDQNLFEDTIGKVPANRTKIAMASALTLEQLILLDVPKISSQTAKNTAQRTNNFLKWAFRREGRKPPFELMGNVRITARSKTVHRRPFTDDELQTLFSPTTYAQGRQQSPYMYWLPLIGLHSGMRINEIAQLALVDVGARDGIACFHVTDDGDDNDETDGRRAK